MQASFDVSAPFSVTIQRLTGHYNHGVGIDRVSTEAHVGE